MANTIYFSKTGRAAIHFRNAQRIPVQTLADGRGLVEIEDTPENASNIEDLRAYEKKHVGGVREIKQSEADELKKNFPFVPKDKTKDAPRLFNMDSLNPMGMGAAAQAQAQSSLPAQAAARVQAAAAQVGVVPAAASGLAPSAVAQAPSDSYPNPTSPTPSPISRGRPVRVGKANSAPSTPMPVAGESELPPATT